MPLAGEDALLGVPDRAGIIRPTPLFERLKQTAAKMKPVLIALDTAADMFGGNENDRGQVRQFIGLLRGLAIDGQCGRAARLAPERRRHHDRQRPVRLDRLAQFGPRTRLYFKGPPSDGEANPDLRELIVKNRITGRAATVRVRWKDGVFVSLGAPSTIDRAAAEQKADEVFLSTAPALHQARPARQQQARHELRPGRLRGHSDGVSKHELTKAMQRLLDAGKIRVEEDGPPSHRRSRLVLS